MKSYDELTNDLLKRRDAYVATKKKKNRIAAGVLASFCCCLIIFVSVTVWGNINNDSIPETVENNTAASHSESETEIQSTVPDESKIVSEYIENSADNSESEKENSSDLNTHTSQGLIDVIGLVIIDGTHYVQFDAKDKIYTPDSYLGYADAYEGTYRTFLSDVKGMLYISKEDPDVLLVKLSNGATVTLKKVSEDYNIE